MKKIFYSLLILKSLYAYQDLGTYGELKEIKERDRAIKQARQT